MYTSDRASAFRPTSRLQRTVSMAGQWPPRGSVTPTNCPAPKCSSLGGWPVRRGCMLLPGSRVLHEGRRTGQRAFERRWEDYLATNMSTAVAACAALTACSGGCSKTRSPAPARWARSTCRSVRPRRGGGRFKKMLGPIPAASERVRGRGEGLHRGRVEGRSDARRHRAAAASRCSKSACEQQATFHRYPSTWKRGARRSRASSRYRAPPTREWRRHRQAKGGSAAHPVRSRREGRRLLLRHCLDLRPDWRAPVPGSRARSSEGGHQ
jgi:hypothetical protein